MRKAIKQIAVCGLALMIICIFCRLTFAGTYTARMQIPQSQREAWQERDTALRPQMGEPEIAHPGEVRIHDDHISIPIRGDHPGASDLQILDAEGKVIGSTYVWVSRGGTVVDLSTGGFTGDTIVLTANTLFWIAVSAIMIWHYFQAKGPAYYAYSTIYYAGFSLFAAATALMMLWVTLRRLIQPENFSMYAAYSTMNGASKWFMTLTMPLMAAFAAAMAVSNIELMRHEGYRLKNALGLMVSLLLIAGEAVGVYLFSRDFAGSEMEGRIRNTLENVYATLFVYFECMLMGSSICGVTAARHEPVPDKDFIVILGCWFRKDGSLPPLLRGRVDRAVAFWKRQKAETGREAVLIPSGGQGRDEPMPEAEAMRRYLIRQEIPADLILPEKESRNTYQNMAYSRKLIDQIKPDGKTIFATTNYHVFRSGVWAGMAGLPAEGIGGKTKWWFWPNAFMRECIGLLQKRWRQELLLLMILLAFFGALSMILG